MQTSPSIPRTFERILSVVADKGYPSLRIQLQYSLLLPFAIDPSIDFSQVVRLLEIHAPAQSHTELGQDEDQENGEGQVKVEVESSLRKIRLSGRSDPAEKGPSGESFGWVVERVRDWFTMNADNLSLKSVCDLTGPSSSSSLDPVFFFVNPLRLTNRTSSETCLAKPRAILQKIQIQIQWDHRASPRTKKRKPRGTKNDQGKRGKAKVKEEKEADGSEIEFVKVENREWDVWSRTKSPGHQAEEDLVKTEQDDRLSLFQEAFDVRRGFLCGRFSSKVPASVIRTFDRAIYKLIRTHLHKSLPLIFNQRDINDRALEIPMFRSVAKSMLGIIERAGAPFRKEAKGLFKNIQAAHQVQRSSFKQALCNLRLGSDSGSDAESDDEPEGGQALAASTFELEISKVLCKISLGVKPSRTVQLVVPSLPTILTPRSEYGVETERPPFKVEPFEGIGSISDFDSDSDSDSDSISDSISDFGLDLESGWATAPLPYRHFPTSPGNENPIDPVVKEEAIEAGIGNRISVKTEEEDEWGPGLYCLAGRNFESDKTVPKMEVDNRAEKAETMVKIESIDLTVGDLPTDSTFGSSVSVLSDDDLDHRVYPIHFRSVEMEGKDRHSMFFRRSLSVIGPTGSKGEDSEASEGGVDRDEEEDEEDEIDWGWSQ